VKHPLIPHGMSVILNAPAAFRFSASGCPERHLQAAQALGADISRAQHADAGKILSDCLIDYMRKLNMPNGLSAVGYNSDDIPKMVEAVYPQLRLTSLSPRPVSKDDVQQIFEDAINYW